VLPTSICYAEPHAETLRYRLQYREARLLLADVNKNRPCKEPYYRHCLNAIAFAFFAPVRLLDWIRISRFGRFLVRKGLVHDRSLSDCKGESAFAKDSEMRREAHVKAKMEDANLTWTMSMAFYALSGGCVYTSKTGEQRVLRKDAIAYLAAFEPQSLLQLQRVVLQNPGKANAIGKAVTCVQAFWFCSQCIARLSGNLAVSLLELNTFAHCISTLLIYIFWWDKPYDVEAHTFIGSKSLDFCFLLGLGNSDRMSAVRVPSIYVPYGSDAIQEDVVTYISDSNGNRLLCANTKPYSLPKLIRDTSDPCHLWARLDPGSNARVFNTGFYVSFECSDSVSAPTYYETHDEVRWMNFWSAWIENDQPRPSAPIIQTEHWLYGDTKGSPDLDAKLVKELVFATLRPTTCVIMTLTSLIYGGLHLLAWHYNFSSRPEQYMWRISAASTTSTGLVLLTLYGVFLSSWRSTALKYGWDDVFSSNPEAEARLYLRISVGLRWLSYLLAVFNIASRAFLFTESFIALPNSPRSTYTIPSWTAYIPHI
jgi:hypothetical protein